MLDFSQVKKINKVYYLTPEDKSFSEFYLEVRKKENRILTDTDILKLPYLKRYEWPLRIKSTKRFTNYIASKKDTLNILEVGCGNGWFSNKIAEVSNKNKVIGLDVNRIELEQASKLFKTENLNFVYAHIFKARDVFTNQLNIIVLNGAIQYFKNFEETIDLLKSFLKPKGEIHILDSPFYKTTQIEIAKQRTFNYYNTLGFPEMAKHYYHHDIKNVSDFEILYQNKNMLIDKILKRNDSPFSWYAYTN